jgi:hypothetical protein
MRWIELIGPPQEGSPDDHGVPVPEADDREPAEEEPASGLTDAKGEEAEEP